MKLHKLRKILIESSIWFVLLIFFIAMLVNAFDEKFIDKPKHIIKFKDVNGLIVGSPVYFAGVNIGHVSDIDLIENEAIVTVKIDNRDVELPKGTYANIEFKGLAGSKSIELFRSPVATQEISSTETIRFSTVTKSYQTYMETVISISDFVMGVVKDTDKKQAKHLVKSTIELLEDIKDKSDGISNGLYKTKEDFGQKTDEARKKVAEFFGMDVSSDVEIDLEQIAKNFDNLNKKLPLSAKIKQFAMDLAGKMTRTRNDVLDFGLYDKNKVKEKLERADEINCSIHKFSKSVQSKYNKNNIENFKCKVEEFKQSIIELNRRMKNGNNNN